jgi:hypothetical protein
MHAKLSLHLSHRERSDRASDLGEGFRSTIVRDPSPEAFGFDLSLWER